MCFTWPSLVRRYEMMKNAARAVVEFQNEPRMQASGTNGSGSSGSSGSSSPPSSSAQTQQGHVAGVGGGTRTWDPPPLPPIVVRICAGRHTNDLTIKISDQGGGIPPAFQSKVGCNSDPSTC